MEISDRLQCLFSAQIERRDGAYVIEIPEREFDIGELDAEGTYQVAVMGSLADDATSDEPETTPNRERPQPASTDRDRAQPGPPLEEGETRRVEIEDIGEQGDGIARVERGYVVIVPDTETGERVRISVTDVRENVAFAEVVERLSYYD